MAILTEQFFVYFALVVALLSVVPNATVLRIIMLVWTGMIALVVVDTFYLWFSLRRAVARRFSGCPVLSRGRTQPA